MAAFTIWHAHAAGDDAIKQIADIIDQPLCTTDKAARFDGEEFVVFCRVKGCMLHA